MDIVAFSQSSIAYLPVRKPSINTRVERSWHLVTSINLFDGDELSAPIHKSSKPTERRIIGAHLVITDDFEIKPVSFRLLGRS
jgi:hypothetical protein